MPSSEAIPLRVIKLAIPSMVGGMVLLWVLASFGIDVRAERFAGLVLLVAGIVLISCTFGFGKNLKWWVLVPLTVVGTLLFAIGGTSVIH